MKANEVGHFPLRIRKFPWGDMSGHERESLSIEDCKLVWKNNLTMLGELHVRELPDSGWNLLVDFQAGSHDCYCADELDNGNVVCLYGSGWTEKGFPFHDEEMSVDSSPYETSGGQYAVLTGKTAKNFYEKAKKDFIPSFESVFSGDMNDLFLSKQ